MFGHAGFSLLCEVFSSRGKWALLSSHGAQAFHCSAFSCCRAQFWVCRLSSCGVYGLSPFTGDGDLPDQGLNLYPLHR